jgi:lipoate---protein ligase
VGAVSRCSLLRLSSSQSLFDVEPFRSEHSRLAVVRDVVQPALVLGSTQPSEVVDLTAARGRNVELVRRRGGGGAVYLAPGAQLWIDTWIPVDDPLWVTDVSAAAEWVGAWWTTALACLGPTGFDVHTGRAEPGALGGLVCFAGRGPGEVFLGGRKVVGLSQWRAREGALFSSCAYLRWNPAPMVELVHTDAGVGVELARDLEPIALGLGELEPPVDDLGRVQDLLLASLATFGTAATADGDAS